MLGESVVESSKRKRVSRWISMVDGSGCDRYTRTLSDELGPCCGSSLVQ